MAIDCWYNDRIELRKGEIIIIKKGIENNADDSLRVTLFSSITSGITYDSKDNYVTMSRGPNPIDPPLIGMVQDTVRTYNRTSFSLRQIKSDLPPLIIDHEYFTKTFISSKLDELQDERRRAIIGTFEGKSLPIYWEKFSSEERPAQEAMIDYLDECHMYIGIFGLEYSEPTILELDKAVNSGMPLMVFVKNLADRDPRLETRLQEFKAEEDGLIYKKFNTGEELECLVRINIPNAIKRLFE